MPFTVSINCPDPAVAEVGEIELIVGGGGFTAKFTLFEVNPVSVTVIGKVPVAATSPAGTVAVSTVGAPVVVVVSALPLKFTTDAPENPLPFTVSVNCAEPTVVEVGEIEVICGTVTTKFTAVEVFPVPVSVTVIGKVPAVATSGAGTVAVSTVGCPVVFVGESAVPLKLITQFAEKFDPFTVNVNAADPCRTEVGFNDEIIGVGVPTEGTANSQAPRPCVPANSSRLEACSASDSTSLFGNPGAKVLQCPPPFVVTNTPISVPA